MKICFVMGSSRISGGTNVIFQHALYLQQHGYEVVIIPQEPFSAHGYKWHPAFDVLTFSDFAGEKETVFDLIVATWWKTIYDLPSLTGLHYMYFVQSVETWFYPDREKVLRELVSNTYRLPMPVIAVADWIKEYLQQKYDSPVYVVHNGIRKELYTSSNACVAPRKKGKIRVLVEGPLGIDFKNVARTIRILKKSKADEIWLLSGRPINRYWGVDRVFSMLPIEKTPEVYRSCDVLVKLSYIEGMFGPPLEMFHCGGTAVVYDVTGHDEYIVHEKNALVVKTGDENGVVAAVNRLVEDQVLLQRLKEGAVETARNWPDWPACSEKFLQIVRIILARPESDREKINSMLAEFWEQYCVDTRSQTTFISRLNAFRLRLINAVERRSPFIEREKRALLAWLWESRRLPETRTKD